MKIASKMHYQVINMFSPKSFYKSKEWLTLRNQLMQERTDENGQIICSHCGQPILRKYDCIGHHKIELTDDNVNDYNISLNPDNIELIHFRCHNEIHERFGGYSKNVYLVYGSPCSGKTSWVNSVAYDDDLIVDMDRLWSAICNGMKPNRLKGNVFGLRDCLYDQVVTRLGNWRNAYIIAGMPLRTDRDRLCDIMNATPIFIEASKEECLKRAEKERPNEWKEYIEDWFDDYIE